jgi:hypothetical protein
MPVREYAMSDDTFDREVCLSCGCRFNNGCRYHTDEGIYCFMCYSKINENIFFDEHYVNDLLAQKKN